MVYKFRNQFSFHRDDLADLVVLVPDRIVALGYRRSELASAWIDVNLHCSNSHLPQTVSVENEAVRLSYTEASPIHLVGQAIHPFRLVCQSGCYHV